MQDGTQADVYSLQLEKLEGGSDTNPSSCMVTELVRFGMLTFVYAEFMISSNTK